MDVLSVPALFVQNPVDDHQVLHQWPRGWCWRPSRLGVVVGVATVDWSRAVGTHTYYLCLARASRTLWLDGRRQLVSADVGCSHCVGMSAQCFWRRPALCV